MTTLRVTKPRRERARCATRVRETLPTRQPHRRRRAEAVSSTRACRRLISPRVAEVAAGDDEIRPCAVRPGVVDLARVERAPTLRSRRGGPPVGRPGGHGLAARELSSQTEGSSASWSACRNTSGSTRSRLSPGQAGPWRSRFVDGRTIMVTLVQLAPLDDEVELRGIGIEAAGVLLLSCSGALSAIISPVRRPRRRDKHEPHSRSRAIDVNAHHHEPALKPHTSFTRPPCLTRRLPVEDLPVPTPCQLRPRPTAAHFIGRRGRRRTRGFRLPRLPLATCTWTSSGCEHRSSLSSPAGATPTSVLAPPSPFALDEKPATFQVQSGIESVAGVSSIWSANAIVAAPNTMRILT